VPEGEGFLCGRRYTAAGAYALDHKRQEEQAVAVPILEMGQSKRDGGSDGRVKMHFQGTGTVRVLWIVYHVTVP
jgi:hypothetical protein